MRTTLKQMYARELAGMLGHEVRGAPLATMPATAGSLTSSAVRSLSDPELAQLTVGADHRALTDIVKLIVGSVLSDSSTGIGDHDRITSLGVDSNDVARLRRRVHAIFNVHVPTTSFNGTVAS